jgi:hypothetical protein
MIKYILLVSISITLFFSHLNAQQLYINELMSSNSSTIEDEDGDNSDWIELFNSEDTPVDLSGFGITDDSTDLFKWIFPAITLAPKNHLLIFASDKNRTEYIRHWETIIDWGDDWRYRLGTSEPSASWKNPGFDDQTWLIGSSGFGYGDDDDSTIVPSNSNSVYVRNVFNIENVNDIINVVLHVDFDDGFVAYLNGVEIARENIGTVGVPPTFDESASNYTEPLIINGIPPNAYAIQNFQSLLQNGENVLAIQVHNYGTGSSDLTLIPFLTLAMNSVPQNARGSNPILNLPKKYLHTNFKLSSDGERILLTNPQGNTVDDVIFGILGNDISYGRQPDGTENWFLFSDATPGDSNVTIGYSGLVESPIASISGGFFTTPITVTLTPVSIGDTIRYTLDGSEPDYSAPIYATPVTINSTKVLRAKSFNFGLMPSRTLTNTYFINFSANLPVVSLSTKPGNFFDEEYGIYAMGDSAEPSFPYFGANFWQDWERPVHVELFEKNGVRGFGIDMGVKIFGNWSRGNAQKSLALFARGEYGYGSLSYKLFDELPFTEYEAFVLRNAGNDWLSTMMRDGLITSIADGIEIDKQDYRPAVVFINAEYWGIHNIREKVNEDFLAQHHNVNPDSLDILENFGEIVEGDNAEYFELYDFVSNNSMVIPANYEYVKSKMDIENFIRYQVFQIYIDNQDWPGNNIKFWKPKNTGKWRWILYDTDFGFGIWDQYAYQNNTLEFATATNGPSWPNPPWSTLLLRKLLNNYQFKNAFINCYADFANTIFKPAIVVNKINSVSSAIAPEMPRHILRWQQFDLVTWQNNIQNMRTFASNRLNFLNDHFTQKFNLSGTSTVTLTITDTAMGSVKLNSIEIISPSWTGYYFFDIPITFIAQPKPGYKFIHWSGSSGLVNDTLVMSPQGNITLAAIFEIDSNYSNPKIVINEVNYNSSATFNTEDWIELYNNDQIDVDISGWIFKDSDDSHVFTIPQGTILEKDSFIVLCIDTTLFKSLFPQVNNYLGNVSFGLSGSGELIRLYDSQMQLIDSLTYDDSTPWPSAPDGNGSSLSLKNPDLENSLGENWAASTGHGTPGNINDIFVNVDNNNQVLPTEYALLQNYPNPFNPVTIIQYSVPLISKVTLKVYDVLGNEVETLVDEIKNPGNYAVQFRANNIASGVYFYRIQADNFSATKKLILIK